MPKESRPRMDGIHAVLRERVLSEARKQGVSHVIAEKVAFLFQHARILPSLKHPEQIISILKQSSGPRSKLTDLKLLAIVDRQLSRDPDYWNVLKVWDTPRMPHQRTAFPGKANSVEEGSRGYLLKKMAEFKET